MIALMCDWCSFLMFKLSLFNVDREINRLLHIKIIMNKLKMMKIVPILIKYKNHLKMCFQIKKKISKSARSRKVRALIKLYQNRFSDLAGEV